MNDIYTIIILTILSIATIRDVLGSTGFVPIDKKFSWIIYGKYDEKIIQRVLISLGYDRIESNRIIADMTKRESTTLTQNQPLYCCERLIDVIKKCIINTGDMFYGNTATKYYIHTMMGSQDNSILNTMADLIIYMILRNANNPKCSKPDYIIVPKNGNPLLGKRIAEKLGIKYILHKSNEEKSRAKTEGEGPNNNKYELDFDINYEGAYYLNKNKELYGIVVDCNTSGGTQLLNAANGFNDLIEKLKFKLKRITDIYTLFKVDSNSGPTRIDETFKAMSYTLYRYFDLNEDIKKMIYDNKDNTSNDNIIAAIRENHLFKTGDFEIK